PSYTGKKTTLAAALSSLGITSTYSFRKQIAAANGITGYLGTASQNTALYNLLTAGLLKRV
ncbi:MAG: M15 family peptidase, partial [Firmicutes bacterium]|nr:M15 family peptidase [Bacillota bacterium]